MFPMGHKSLSAEAVMGVKRVVASMWSGLEGHHKEVTMEGS